MMIILFLNMVAMAYAGVPKLNHSFLKNQILILQFGISNCAQMGQPKISRFFLFCAENVVPYLIFNQTRLILLHDLFTIQMQSAQTESPLLRYFKISQATDNMCNSWCMKYEVSSPDIVCRIKSRSSVPNTTGELVRKKCCVQDHLQGLLCSQFDKSIIYSLERRFLPLVGGLLPNF